MLDSDSDSEGDDSAHKKDVEKLNKRLEAQKLEADRTSELQRMQERQKRESKRRELRRQQSGQIPRAPAKVHSDLQDLDFGSVGRNESRKLQAPLRPDSDEDEYAAG